MSLRLRSYANTERSPTRQSLIHALAAASTGPESRLLIWRAIVLPGGRSSQPPLCHQAPRADSLQRGPRRFVTAISTVSIVRERESHNGPPFLAVEDRSNRLGLHRHTLIQ